MQTFSTLFSVLLLASGAPLVAVAALLAWDDVRARGRDAGRWGL